MNEAMHSMRLHHKPQIKEFPYLSIFCSREKPHNTVFTILFIALFHNKLDISSMRVGTVPVLLICSLLAVSQLMHYGGRLLMKLKAGCGDNYSYRQISCCSESITM